MSGKRPETLWKQCASLALRTNVLSTLYTGRGRPPTNIVSLACLYLIRLSETQNTRSNHTETRTENNYFVSYFIGTASRGTF